MEQELNTFRNQNGENTDFFKVEYKNQDVNKFPEFRKWYKKTYQYIKNENIRRGKAHDVHNGKILIIAFCDICLSYVICSVGKTFCYIECNKCKTFFCIGCARKQQKFLHGGDDTVCIKGYFKSFYLRAYYRRSSLVVTHPLFHIMHIILCLFFTPLYIGFISNGMGLIMHTKRKLEKKKFNQKFKRVIAYSIFRGLLMFPYMTIFFPFMFILLLPGVFFYKYYLYVYVAYITAIWPDSGSLDNVGDN